MAVGQYDLYTLFIEHSKRVLSEHGVSSFIIPTRMLSNENFMLARQFVMTHMPITHYVNAEKPFENANVEANIMVCQKGVLTPNVSSFVLNTDTHTPLNMLLKYPLILYRTCPLIYFPLYSLKTNSMFYSEYRQIKK